MTEETTVQPEKSSQPKIIDVLIFSFVAILLVSIMALTFFEVVNGQRDYERALDTEFGQALLDDGGEEIPIAAAPINRPYVIALLRASDFAFMRSATLMLAFTLIFLGALVLFKSLQNAYELSASQAGTFDFKFSTASSGLVLSTLGFLLVIAALFAKNNVDFQDNSLISTGHQEVFQCASDEVLFGGACILLQDLQRIESTFDRDAAPIQ